MKRVLSVLLLLLGLAAPASAQGLVTLETLHIQFWPEYDQPAMLVIYDFSLPADADFPVDVNVRIPAGAQLLAVAKEDGGALINASYNGPTRSGDWDIVSIAVNSADIYRLEYYAPLQKSGTARNYAYTWNGDYPVGSFTLRLQEPLGAREVRTTPEAQEIAPGPDGFVYHTYTAQELQAGQTFTWNLVYQKDSDALSASSVGVEPAAPLAGNVDGRTSVMNNLPLLLGMLGLVLVLGGVVWYWLAGRSNGRSGGKLRKRHTARDEDDDDDKDGEIYCPQCGKRAGSSDRFCRACGTRLRRNN